MTVKRLSGSAMVLDEAVEKAKFEFSESATLYMAHCAAPEITGNPFWRKLVPHEPA